MPLEPSKPAALPDSRVPGLQFHDPQFMQRAGSTYIAKLPKEGILPVSAEDKYLVKLQPFCHIKSGYRNPFPKDRAVSVNIRHIFPDRFYNLTERSCLVLRHNQKRGRLIPLFSQAHLCQRLLRRILHGSTSYFLYFPSLPLYILNPL